MGRYPIRLIFLSLMVSGLPMQAALAGCGPEAYFSESDYDHKTPLAAPSREFAEDMRSAKAGNHIAQRNVGIYYETGYLVNQCDERAVYWYEKAAKGGDAVALKWMAEHNALENLTAGPECIGEACGTSPDDAPQQITLNAKGSRGHFFTDISVGGNKVVGMIDTGASTVAMSAATAASLGIGGGGFSAQRVGTANGMAISYNKVIPLMKIGTITLTNVEISIAPNTTMTLIGMSALRKLKVHTGNGIMTLSK